MHWVAASKQNNTFQARKRLPSDTTLVRLGGWEMNISRRLSYEGEGTSRRSDLQMTGAFRHFYSNFLFFSTQDLNSPHELPGNQKERKRNTSIVRIGFGTDSSLYSD